MPLVWRGGCGGLQDMGTRALEGENAPSVFSSGVFAPMGDERNASVTLTVKAASKGSKHSPCTNVPAKCLF